MSLKVSSSKLTAPEIPIFKQKLVFVVKILNNINFAPRTKRGAPGCTHIFRIGATTHAVSMGFSDQVTHKMGRWNTDAFENYIRIQSFKL